MQASPVCATRILKPARSRKQWTGLLAAGLLTITCAASNSLAGDHHTLRFVTSSGYSQSFKTMAFSPDGSELAVCTSSERVAFVSTADGEITGHYKQLTPFSMSYSRDGSRLFMISGNDSHLIDTRRRSKVHFQRKSEPGFIGINLEKRNGKLLFSHIQPGGPVDALGKINVGDELVGVGKSKSDSVYDVIGASPTSAVERMKGPAGTHVQLSVIQKGRLNAKTYTVRRLPKKIQGGRLVFAEFDAEAIHENLVWCTRDGRHSFDSAATGQTLASIETDAVETRGQYSISPDATQFAVLASRRGREDYAIEFFDLARQQPTGVIDFPKESWFQIAFSHDAQHLYISTHNTVEILDLPTEQYLRPIWLGSKKAGRPSVDGLAVSPVGILAIATRGRVELWNPQEHKKIDSLANYSDELSELCFSPNGQWLAYFDNDEGVLHIIEVSEYSAIPDSNSISGADTEILSSLPK